MERVWPFPIGEEYLEPLLKSNVADILQCTEGGGPDHIYAATFLNHFIGNEIPWIHVDMCSKFNRGGLGLVATECTGFGIEWGLRMIEDITKTSLGV